MSIDFLHHWGFSRPPPVEELKAFRDAVAVHIPLDLARITMGYIVHPVCPPVIPQALLMRIVKDESFSDDPIQVAITRITRRGTSFIV